MLKEQYQSPPAEGSPGHLYARLNTRSSFPPSKAWKPPAANRLLLPKTSENIAITGKASANGNGYYWPVRRDKLTESEWKAHLKKYGRGSANQDMNILLLKL